MINKNNAEHYVWGQNCDGWHLVKADGLSFIHARMPPAASEVRHLHRVSRQFFFVLSGTATLEVDGKRETLQAHQGREVAPGVPHQMFNDSGSETEFLVMSQPPSYGDRVLVSDPAQSPSRLLGQEQAETDAYLE